MAGCETKLTIKYSTQFKKDVKKAQKQSKNLDKLFTVIERIANHEPLEPSLHDHDLSGKYKGTRKCHIEPDWLLIYEVQASTLVLMLYRNGSHAELFGK